jgi:hypothetical protein
MTPQTRWKRVVTLPARLAEGLEVTLPAQGAKRRVIGHRRVIGRIVRWGSLAYLLLAVAAPFVLGIANPTDLWLAIWLIIFVSSMSVIATAVAYAIYVAIKRRVVLRSRIREGLASPADRDTELRAIARHTMEVERQVKSRPAVQRATKAEQEAELRAALDRAFAAYEVARHGSAARPLHGLRSRWHARRNSAASTSDVQHYTPLALGQLAAIRVLIRNGKNAEAFRILSDMEDDPNPAVASRAAVELGIFQAMHKNRDEAQDSFGRAIASELALTVEEVHGTTPEELLVIEALQSRGRLEAHSLYSSVLLPKKQCQPLLDNLVRRGIVRRLGHCKQRTYYEIRLANGRVFRRPIPT